MDTRLTGKFKGGRMEIIGTRSRTLRGKRDNMQKLQGNIGGTVIAFDAPGMPKTLMANIDPRPLYMPQGRRWSSASTGIEADVIDRPSVIRRTFQATENKEVTGINKRDIPNRQNKAVIIPCSETPSQNGTISWLFRTLDGKNRTKTAPRIPSNLVSLEAI